VNVGDLCGVIHYFDDFRRDVEVMTKHKPVMQRLGIMGGQNYLLHGRCGTGKTSFAKAVATEFDAPIYSVKLHSVPSRLMSKALCPEHRCPIAVVLIEDFDRYLTGEIGRDAVSELLNALDGIYPAPNIFRFFSANFPERIVHDDAMNTRMRRKFHFDIQTKEGNFEYIRRLFADVGVEDEDHIRLISEAAEANKLPLRTIHLHLSRFLCEPNPLKSAADAVFVWLEELTSISVPKDDNR